MTATAPDPRDTEHGTADPKAVADSMRHDRERWSDAHRNHNATALRRRAIAAANGHGHELGWEKD